METAPGPESGRLRTGIVAVWLVIFANGALFFVARRLLERPGTWEGPVARPAIVLATALGVALVVLDGQRLSGDRLRPVPAVPFVTATAFGGWAMLTTFWSLDAEITLWRGLVYVFLPCVAWVVADLSPRAWTRALAWGAGIPVAASLVVVATNSRWGTDFNDDWRGIMTNRNGFAPVCVLAILAGAALVIERRRGWGGLLIAIGLVGLAGSGSRTAWFAFAVALGFATLVVVARRRHLTEPGAPVVRASLAVAAAGLVAAVVGVAVLWNESTFEQRRTIWRLVGDQIDEAPLFGNGWSAFWYSPELHTDELLQRGSAHGSIPELLLGVGVVGLVLWLVVVGYAAVGVGRAVWQRPGAETWLWTAIVVFLLMENLTESFVLWFSYNWIILIAAALRFGRAAPRSPALRTPERIATATG